MSSTTALHASLGGYAEGGILQSVRARVVADSEPCLVVARAQSVEVYRMHKSRPTLQRLGAFALHGVVAGMDKIRLPGNDADTILVCFADARLSLLQWDPQREELRSTHAYYFEHLRDVLNKEMRGKPLAPLLRVDPDNRCVLLLCFRTSLLCFPVNQTPRMSGRGGGGAQQQRLLIPVKRDINASAEEAKSTAARQHRSVESETGIQYVANATSVNVNDFASPEAVFHEPFLIPLGEFSGSVDILGDVARKLHETEQQQQQQQQQKQHSRWKPRQPHPSSSSSSSSQTSTTKKSSIIKTFKYVSRVCTVLHDVRAIRDVCFLEGYNEPVVVLLHDTRATWVGRSATGDDSTGLTSLTLSMAQSSYFEFGKCLELPTTTYALHPCPRPLGGCVALSASLMMHFTGVELDFALSVNEFGDKFARQSILQKSKRIFRLDCASLCFLSPRVCLLTSLFGEVFMLVFSHVGGSVSRVEATKVGVTSMGTTAIAALKPSLVFLASRTSNSVLVQLEDAVPSDGLRASYDDDDEDDMAGNASMADSVFGDALVVGNTAKRRKLSKTAEKKEKKEEDEEEEDESEEEEEEFMGIALVDKIKEKLDSGKLPMSFTVIDALPCRPPVADLCALTDEKSGINELLACGGMEDDGCVTLMTGALVPSQPSKGRFELPHQITTSSSSYFGYFGVCYILETIDGKSKSKSSRSRSSRAAKNAVQVRRKLLWVLSDKTKTYVCGVDSSSSSSDGEGKLSLVKTTEIQTSERTLFVHTLTLDGGKATAPVTVQVTTQAIYVLDKQGKLLHRRQDSTGKLRVAKLRDDCLFTATSHGDGVLYAVSASKPYLSVLRMLTRADATRKTTTTTKHPESSDDVVANGNQDQDGDDDVLVRMRDCFDVTNLTLMKLQHSGHSTKAESAFAQQLLKLTNKPYDAALAQAFREASSSSASSSGVNVMDVDNSLASSSSSSSSSGVSANGSSALLPQTQQFGDLSKLISSDWKVDTDIYAVLDKTSTGKQRALNRQRKSKRKQRGLAATNLDPIYNETIAQEASQALLTKNALFGPADTQPSMMEMLGDLNTFTSHIRVVAHCHNGGRVFELLAYTAAQPDKQASPRSMEVVFQTRNIQRGYGVLRNHLLGGAGSQEQFIEGDYKDSADSFVRQVVLREVNSVLVLVLVLNSGQLYVYKGFFTRTLSHEQQSALALSFRRVPHIHSISDRGRKTPSSSSSNARNGVMAVTVVESPLPGLVIGNWLVSAQRGTVRIHPIHDSFLPAGAPHAATAAPGAHAGDFWTLRGRSIAALKLPESIEGTEYERHPLKTHPNVSYRLQTQPTEGDASLSKVCYDSLLPFRRFVVGGTVRFVRYHEPTDSYVVVLSRQFTCLGRELSSARSLDVFETRYEIVLYSRQTWKIVGRFETFQANERVTCCEPIVLENPDKRQLPRCYVCIGTIFVRDEDTLTKGRVLVLDLEYKEGTSHTGGKVTLLKVNAFQQEETEPVIGIAALENKLLLACTRRILMYEWDSEERSLTAKAFWDCDFHVLSLATIKNFVVFGDVLTSASLLVYDHNLNQLVLLGRDLAQGEACSTEFLVDGDQLNVIRFDAGGNLQILEYDPRIENSYMRKKLVRRCDFHVGVPSRASIRLRANTPANDFLKSVVLSGDIHASLHMVVPLDETVFRRFYALFMQMSYSLPHLASLNPIAFRTYVPVHVRGSLGQNRKNVVDADLLWLFVSLDTVSQFRLAKSIGTTREVILNNIAIVLELLRV